jgi:hypothetical protein
MNDDDFEALHKQIPPWHNRQLASIVKPSLSLNMSRVLTAKRPRGATGLELLRDVVETLQHNTTVPSLKSTS